MPRYLIKMHLNTWIFSLAAVLASSLLHASDWDVRQRLTLLGQWAQTREKTEFNPGLFPRQDQAQQLSLDNDLQWRFSPHWSSAARMAWIGEQNGYRSEVSHYERQRDSSALLLEGELSWHSRFRSRQLRIGRIKPQWSQGFNWPVVDLLKPNRSRPSFDQDNLRQQQGVDMINLRWRHQALAVSALVATLDDEQYSARHQSALRLTYEGDLDAGLVWHYIPTLGSQWGLNISRLLGDATSLRFEAALERQRDLASFDLAPGAATPNTNYELGQYWKLLAGLQHSWGQWDVRGEYLYNQHGYSKAERQQLSAWANDYKAALSTAQAGHSYQFFASASQAMAHGQLAKNALYLMYGNGRSSGFWHWQQSVQWNLDDYSQYHQLQLGQRWSDGWSSRLQLEYFHGDKASEYGRLAQQTVARLAVYWSF